MAFETLWLQNVDYPARQDRIFADNIWTEGILGASSLTVSQSSPTAMSVQVSAGVAVIQGDDQAAQGKYISRESAPTTGVTIGAAPGSGTRYDLVVLRVRDPNATGPAGDNAIIQVVAGTPSSTPVDPAVPNSAIVLARVRVPAGTGVITNALIDDLRVHAELAHNVIPAGSVTVSDLASSVANALAPTGSIMQYAGTSAPAGWLLCDGSAYSTTTYAALFAVIGSAYNTSAGQSAPAAGNFRVPIMQGRVPAGLDVGQASFNALGNTGGANQVTLTSAEMPSHTHVQDAHNHTQNAHSHTNPDHDHLAFTGNAGYHSHEVNTRTTTNSTHTHVSGTRVASTPSPSTANDSMSSNPVADHSHTVTVSLQSLTTNSSTATNNATTATNQSTGGGGAHNNLQPYIVVNYIIKA